jgi:GNAT superfamily N-acetyltransferase
MRENRLSGSMSGEWKRSISHRATPRLYERWFRPLRVSMSFESYKLLPRHPAYTFEYWDSQLRISPRWQSHSMFLEIRPPETRSQADDSCIASVRPLVTGDWKVLPEVLAEAFQDTPPLGTLGWRRRVYAARDWLYATRDGSEGPLVEPACVVAVDREDNAQVLGVLVVTLMIGWTRSCYASRRLEIPPSPPDLAEDREQPQVSWIFVQPGASGQGVGTALLEAAMGSLWSLGYRELASATHRGNDSSMAWHWRNGFRLLPHPESIRLIRSWDRRQPDP